MEQTNPLLRTYHARIPGETFRLPSQGVFYNDGELDDTVKNGEVYIYPLTTIAEIELKTPDKLLSGQSIVDAFKQCVPAVKDPFKLLAKDVDYILMCMQLLSYGETMELVYNHRCSDTSKEHKYTINIRPLIQQTKPIDPTTVGEHTTVHLPNNQVVVLRPPLFGAMMQLYLANVELDSTNESHRIEFHKRMLQLVVSSIISVDDITDKDQIQEWIQVVPPSYINQITECAKYLSDFGPVMDITEKCADCGEEIVLSVPLNPVSFFS